MSSNPIRGKPDYAFKAPKKVIIEQVKQQQNEEREEAESLGNPLSVPSPFSIGSVDDILNSPGRILSNLGSPSGYADREYVSGLNSQGCSLRSNQSSVSSPGTPQTPSPGSQGHMGKEYCLEQVVAGAEGKSGDQSGHRTGGPTKEVKCSGERSTANQSRSTRRNSVNTGQASSSQSSADNKSTPSLASSNKETAQGSGNPFEAFMNPSALAGLSPEVASHVAYLAQASAVLLASGNPQEVLKDLAKLFGVGGMPDGEKKTEPQTVTENSESEHQRDSECHSDSSREQPFAHRSLSHSSSSREWLSLHESSPSQEQLSAHQAKGPRHEKETEVPSKSHSDKHSPQCEDTRRNDQSNDIRDRSLKDKKHYSPQPVEMPLHQAPIPNVGMTRQLQSQGPVEGHCESQGQMYPISGAHHMASDIRLPYSQSRTFNHPTPSHFAAGFPCIPGEPLMQGPHYQQDHGVGLLPPASLSPRVPYHQRGVPEPDLNLHGHGHRPNSDSHGNFHQTHGSSAFRARSNSEGHHFMSQNLRSSGFNPQAAASYTASQLDHCHMVHRSSFGNESSYQGAMPGFRQRTGHDSRSSSLPQAHVPNFNQAQRRASESCVPHNLSNTTFPPAPKCSSNSHPSDNNSNLTRRQTNNDKVSSATTSDSRFSQNGPSSLPSNRLQNYSSIDVDSSSTAQNKSAASEILGQKSGQFSQLSEVSSSKDAFMPTIKQEMDWSMDVCSHQEDTTPHSSGQPQGGRRPSTGDVGKPGDAKLPRRPSITISNKCPSFLGENIDLIEVDEEELCKSEDYVSQSTTGITQQMECQMCQVCGDIAAGFHCGAYVCEACKKFFVRCHKQDASDKFVCTKDKSCLISKETRTQCQYCRFQKCTSLGMYKPGTGPGASISSDISFIPCKVCGAPSSGYHFGAITCEGCKGFFRRTVKEREGVKYTCNRDGECDITTSTRNICKYCRYHKCLLVGMKPDGSRIGRQPNSIKHATLLELQQIKAEKGFLCPKDEADMVSLPGEGITPIPKPKELENPVAGKPRIHQEYLDTIKLRTSSHTGPSKLHTCMKIFAPGAITLSPSLTPKEVWEAVMANFGQCAMATLKFAKKIPDFRNLPIDSQIGMVQTSMYPVVLIMMSTLYDVGTDSYNYFHLTDEEIDVIMGNFPPFKVLLNHFASFGKVLKVMDLDELEVAMLAALFILRDAHIESDTCIQETAMLALEEYCCYKYGPATNRHGNILLRLGDLARVNTQHQEAVLQLMQENPSLEIPQLYRETFVND